MELSTMNTGSSARIVGFGKADRNYRRKLLSMGLTPGTEITVVRVAPMGDPVQIQLRGFPLTLRKEEGVILKLEEIT